ncbi:Uncharacterized protein AC503_1589 [Pseudomonas syringae pv. maculicola]|nr:Uncharacterized protein AC503_1589 [Pseudomonas syringae pv. maculicola]
MIAQLRNYYGTSVTNVIEEIMLGVVQRLGSEKAFPRAFSSGDKLYEDSVWVEHYAEGIGFSPEGSWAIVTLDEGNNPDWEYVSLDSVVARSGVELDFFALSDEDLHFKR